MKFPILCTVAFLVIIGNAFADQQFILQRQDFESAPQKSDCLESDLKDYADGVVNFRTFSASCFEEINRRRYNPASLKIYEAHIARNDVISQLKWDIVSYLSGVAADSMNNLPWSNMSKLEGLQVDFDKLEQPSTFPTPIVSTIPQSVIDLDVIGEPFPDTYERISCLLSRLAPGLKKYAMSGRRLPAWTLNRHFINNTALKWLSIEIENESFCKVSFIWAIKIMSNSHCRLETVQLLCNSYTVHDIQTIFIYGYPTLSLFLKAGSAVYVDWMRKVIEVGDGLTSFSVSIISSGVNGLVKISRGKITPPSAPNHIEVKRAWIDLLVERAKKYSDEADFRRIFNDLYTGYYGERRGIQQSQLDEFEKFIASHPM